MTLKKATSLALKRLWSLASIEGEALASQLIVEEEKVETREEEVLLEQRSTTSIAERMKGYQVVAMVIIMGPKLKHIQDLIQSEIKHMMSGYFRPTTVRKMSSESVNEPSRPPIFASCSSFGAKQAGVVIRLLSTTTEAVYEFLRHHLGGLEQFLGAPPYRR